MTEPTWYHGFPLHSSVRINGHRFRIEGLFYPEEILELGIFPASHQGPRDPDKYPELGEEVFLGGLRFVVVRLLVGGKVHLKHAPRSTEPFPPWWARFNAGDFAAVRSFVAQRSYRFRVLEAPVHGDLVLESDGEGPCPSRFMAGETVGVKGLRFRVTHYERVGLKKRLHLEFRDADREARVADWFREVVRGWAKEEGFEFPDALRWIADLDRDQGGVGSKTWVEESRAPTIHVTKKFPSIPDGAQGSELRELTVCAEVRGKRARASDVFALHDVVTGHTWADMFESIGKIFREMEEDGV